MTRPTIRLLLVEDDPSDAELVREALAESRRPRFEVEHATHLRTARDVLGRSPIDLVLLDLGLPDAQGVGTLQELLAAHPRVPCIVLTGLDDDDLGLWAVQHGAQDFVVKDRPVPELLARSIRYAIERHGMTTRLETVAREAQASEARFRHLVGRSTEGILVVDGASVVRFANGTAESLLRCAPGRLVGSPLELPVRPAGPVPREIELPRRDGTSFPADVRVAEIEWEGGTAILVSLYDLTDRKRADRIALAQSVQRSFLPERKELRTGGFEICATNSLYEDVSGDFYDVVPHDDGRVTVAIGDATGHGYGPALVMAQGRAYLRAFARMLDDLPSVVKRMNDALAADMADGRFMSLFAATLDPATGAVAWCNAGHVPALLLRGRTGAVERLEATGLVLGVVADAQFRAGEPVTLGPDDALLLCSDGATEAADPGGAHFGEARVADVLRRAAPAGARAVLDALRTALDAFTDGRPVRDDVTLLAIGRPARPAPLSPPTDRARSGAVDPTPPTPSPSRPGPGPAPEPCPDDPRLLPLCTPTDGTAP